ncbi:Helix-turn-helix domain-containing protein [Thermomonospora echinospora]|uniref:Helix-turn-helix domain-containing protein n=1 Tax=Thermomonospora echinospora TaxID=1992 RepID=A0A1H6A9D4_9ACTN|nr:helix-turn-helix transcriptional regulator [Thermomonospora echinospora]SEG45343.1 Helix-turn-helix domain-containing protein [Thermomonospora echinospora]
MTEHGPTTRQRRLAAELRKLREANGLTMDRAATALGWPQSKLSELETARQIPKTGDVEAILATYGGVDQAVKLALLQLVRDVRQRGWWASFGDVLSGSYAELEYAADRIRIWQVQLVPGLLQTEDYARTLIRRHFPDESDAEIDRRVQVRVTRRAMLTRQKPPRLEVLLAEEVIRRPVGGREIMRGQLGALLHAGQRPNVSIRVVPISAGDYPSMGTGGVVLFEFDESSVVDLSVAYLETMAGSRYEEDISQVRACSLMYDRIAEFALTESDSADLIRTTMKEM